MLEEKETIWKIDFHFTNICPQNLVLKPDSDVRKMWSKAPFAVTFKVYIFNITNPDVVVRGGKVGFILNFIFHITDSHFLAKK